MIPQLVLSICLVFHWFYVNYHFVCVFLHMFLNLTNLLVLLLIGIWGFCKRESPPPPPPSQCFPPSHAARIWTIHTRRYIARRCLSRSGRIVARSPRSQTIALYPYWTGWMHANIIWPSSRTISRRPGRAIVWAKLEMTEHATILGHAMMRRQITCWIDNRNSVSHWPRHLSGILRAHIRCSSTWSRNMWRRIRWQSVNRM